MCLKNSCLGDAKKSKEIVKKKIIFKFLLRLNKNLDKVWGCTLGMKLLPNIQVVFFEVRWEEGRKKGMFEESLTTSTTENFALIDWGIPYNYLWQLLEERETIVKSLAIHGTNIGKFMVNLLIGSLQNQHMTRKGVKIIPLLMKCFPSMIPTHLAKEQLEVFQKLVFNKVRLAQLEQEC